MIDVEGTKEKVDMVNHPKHYAESCSLECIETMILVFGNKYVARYCVINAYKYLWRCEFKNKLEDLAKSRWYLEKFEELYRFCGYDKELEELFKKYEYMIDEIIPRLEKKIGKM